MHPGTSTLSPAFAFWQVDEKSGLPTFTARKENRSAMFFFLSFKVLSLFFFLLGTLRHVSLHDLQKELANLTEMFNYFFFDKIAQDSSDD